ncbi:hypothetical protein ACSQ67_019230 [Phaseolus vulgaris]
MVGPQYDFLSNPLGAVRSTFDTAIASGTDPSSLEGRDWGALPFSDTSSSNNPESLRSPFSPLPPSDLLGPIHSCGWFDVEDEQVYGCFTISYLFFGGYANLGTETALLCPGKVPGLSPWTEVSAEEFGNLSMDWMSDSREKRMRDDESSDMPVSCDKVQDSPNTKRMREGEHSSAASHSSGAATDIASSTTSLGSEIVSNSPPCIVKIYDSPESEMKLNDIFEFVGILTSDPELQEDNEDGDLSDGFSEDTLRHFPPNQVPRLHCFIHRKLGIQDFLQNNHTVEPKPDLVKGLREALLRHLTTILGNDDVTSHFMLLHLLSKVHARDNGLAVGKLSLNLTGFKKETVSVFGKQLTLVLKKLLPLTFCIPLTVEYLNTVSLAPKKNYDTNRLETGVLQLAEGSHLIVDETKLEAGTLNSVGVDNCRLLKNLMELQEVEYDFKYYKMDMKTDAQLLVMSEGKSNILPADVIVPFQPSTLSYSEAVTPEVLEAWRWYLATVRQLTHSIEPEMQKVVERDLVAARQADRTLSPQDLSRLVTMGRLMSLSYGESSLSLEHWQMVKELERLRKQRLQ